MHRGKWLAALAVAGWMAAAASALAQVRPYIGYVYPAGGQQGTTFQIKLGGQGLTDVNHVLVTGTGVTARIVEYDRALNPQEITLLNEQLKELKQARTNVASAMAAEPAMMMSDTTMMASGAGAEKPAAPPDEPEDAAKLVAKITKRVSEYVNRPASVALANIVYAEVTVAPDAAPGARELRLGTPQGVSNPLVFFVGQLPEVCRKPMITAPLQVLGKEEQALRKRPDNEVEQTITVPCTVNGQVASGELNRYRFAARKGQNLVITTQARQLIPFIADAVPGWFQPVLVLYDSRGKEVAYDDDFRFKPDPTMLYRVPEDGDYSFVIYDAIYRGREDFVYRVTIGEIPFVTSLFPLGGRVDAPPVIKVRGWNLGTADLAPPPRNVGPGIYSLSLNRDSLVSNPLPFALDTLPETVEREPNDSLARAQKITLPLIVNGRMDRPGDWDVFQFKGQSNDLLVAEVYARRLDSPLDSVLKLTDATGRLLAFNDDSEDLAAGVNTHYADSYFRVRLPADGTYYVHLGDTARNAGEEYGYRLRLSAPEPDFALRVVPSSVSLRSKGSVNVNVHVIRKDGFTGPIKLALKDPPTGFSAAAASLSGTQTVARLTIKTDLKATPEPVNLSIIGTARIGGGNDSAPTSKQASRDGGGRISASTPENPGRDVTHEAVPAEDRMQAFLWRHLVPATEFKALVYDPSFQPAPRRVPRARPTAEPEPKPVVAATNAAPDKPKFTKAQVAGRLRQLKLLFEEGLLTDDFYEKNVAECEAIR